MKRKDFKPCMFCKKGVAHDNSLTFYEIELTYHVLNLSAIQREHGLEQYLGGGQQGATLADAIGPNPELTGPLRSMKGLVCLECAMNKRIVQILEEK